MATWRKTVATAPSMRSLRRFRRSAGSVASARRRPNVTVSPNTEAVSAIVNGVDIWNIPRGRAR
jgi:hypothetical protein